MDWREWKVEERASVGNCGRKFALLLKKREDMLEVSGLISVRDGINACEYPRALVAAVGHQVTCVVMVGCDVESGTSGV